MVTSSGQQQGPDQWYITRMRMQWEADPTSVDASWQQYFTSEGRPTQIRTSVPPAPPAPTLHTTQDTLTPAPTPRTPTDTGNSPSASLPHNQSMRTFTSPKAIVTAEVMIDSGQSDIDPADSHITNTDVEIETVTRSDLPPMPRTHVAEATSPYTRQKHGKAASALNAEALSDDITETLRAVARATAKNMDDSLSVPTATSQREIPAKLLIENRSLMNTHLSRTIGGKISFTHLIGYAIVEALCEMPKMNVRYSVENNKPHMTRMAHVGLGLAIDVTDAKGNRSLMVPVIHNADTMTFMEFVDAYQDIVTRARKGELGASDFVGTTVTLTNPGTLGTTTSVPRLMNGQGLIIGVGATDYPAAYAGVSPKRLALLGIGRTMYMSSTYDHRVIQGAASGEFLRLISTKLTGKDGFYDRVFASLHIPHSPYLWEPDHEYDAEREKGKPARIAELIHAYRSRGHLASDTDPLAYRIRQHPDLALSRYGLSVWDLDRPFPTGGFGDSDHMLLRDILERLRDTYTRTVGIEYMHIQDPEQRRWVQQRIEGPYEPPSQNEQRSILDTLIRAEAFEEFLQTKYVGQKRFSLEGGESLIPLLDQVMRSCARDGIHEVAIGMAHRGRLNVLANIAGKSYAQIFSEFEGNQDPRTVQGSGDVKYHLGTEGVYSVEDGLATKVYLAANPSHLEAANGVLEGIVRAKQDELNDPSLPVVPVLIHGDAAFIGQGVVQECLNLSQLKGYRTGGTIHVIVNNQIGFTTGPTSGRSTRYPTDLAKGLQVPILHVNADDPEQVIRVARLATEYRNEFHKDVIIDLVCYRRRGHNEGDDPSMTQPVMYNLIGRIPSTRAVYVRNLIGRGQLTEDEAAELAAAYENQLVNILEETRENGWVPTPSHDDSEWEIPESQLPGQGMMIGWSSAVSSDYLQRIGDAQTAFPEGFTPHPKIRQLCEKRAKMASGQLPIDWGFGELLALGTLLMEGTPVRFSGQDARRATFVQRHAVLHDNVNGREFTPLQFLTDSQAPFAIFDSPLSEYAVMAYEYGYSVERPDALVIWEAQFGDFAIGAQTVIDEFVCSAEQKWGQRSSVVLLLPHGYEGQGPDHSSARIERYLQLCAQDNMWVVQPSTPANHFHMLRTQAYRRPRKPLIAFTPKQLLRLSAATSSVDEFTQGAFTPVYGEMDSTISTNVDRVVLCSGRLYYDLVREREKRGDTRTALIRIEQFYPLPVNELREVLAPYAHAEFVWAQDEPANQGPWPFLALELFPQLDRPVRRVSRPASATTAAGRAALHQQQLRTLLDEAFMR
ncbi:multifunctional oxoglutarate decarboxylase/oxoglutarate dehydrogenase thiamine pyrophosphate-binding subunit/dihydrolipoyllysine-residue succinyltransferase subunit [Schaalia sp. lx-260]|uniref:multifunctional oxoglutarate decarboxylase/oxoglutarate dehydrogenase thiamine pyrophosphate-binding subunit/dihydrolipoyllysine-residue succinyltransferase subunit n=1 Tax=Schaalia sp. lx-260 TaxID=2899082 RepID=UPI001E3807DD|nr:multifunctional oxoglutarate decarboxylase/oxoglutarate dehydrogenase thiamine pyrophosphate-binding subunit/dihydrolipoyllysine-residue succinyltransferase subunit [Schaalia sp. lx-260]MCD4549719.1 multifunctional oxoglutarate decarboxylase/oxoglutarate dehydrogenase thiamine pyrophosphate-binding subunit/dihydrolipoyllysine-residue succinyltransferase subunit [Schaalia sp. lx-260]